MDTSILQQYEHWLREDEKAEKTVEKYMRDVKKFLAYMKEGTIVKERVISFKEELRKKYQPVSANSIIAAVNSFLGFLGLTECRVKQYKIQKKMYSNKELTKEEYIRLIDTAKKRKNRRLSLVIQVMGGSGIRVSELAFITVEAVRDGNVEVTLKNKTRTVFLPHNLKEPLLHYAKAEKISSGPIFVTRTGKTLNRSNIWKEMKSLCQEAKVDAAKVFPHNLRHLFARAFFGIEKDIVKLADLLGHNNIETTRIYLIETGTYHEKIINQMGLIP
jgi:integrase/recombinase XerD